MPCEACKRDGQAALVSGKKAVFGCVSGRARVAPNPDDILQLVDGEILVTTMTNPEATPAMQRAAAVVTERGGILCHAAIVSREFNIPCIVGTGDATQRISNGAMIAVCANNGAVYAIT